MSLSFHLGKRLSTDIKLTCNSSALLKEDILQNIELYIIQGSYANVIETYKNCDIHLYLAPHFKYSIDFSCRTQKHCESHIRETKLNTHQS